MSYYKHERRRVMRRIIVLLVMMLMTLTANAGEKREFGEPIPTNVKVVGVDELVKNVKAYEGQMVVVEGRMGDICADGEDFSFKGKFELIEVLPPAGQMPPKSMKGKAAKVYGKVKVKHEKEEKGEKKESGDSEIKIEAKGVRFP
mgnify:CR=1 FL=1